MNQKVLAATPTAVAPHPCEDREQLIRETAYFNAEGRGFEPGHELEDWLAAEHEVDLRIAGTEVKQGFYG